MDKAKWRVRKLRRDMPPIPGVSDDDYQSMVKGRPWGAWPPLWDIGELPMFVAREHGIVFREALARADFPNTAPSPEEQIIGWFTSTEGAKHG
jgi:hypothetical protein